MAEQIVGKIEFRNKNSKTAASQSIPSKLTKTELLGLLDDKDIQEKIIVIFRDSMSKTRKARQLLLNLLRES